jgi:hypothetical protein
MMNDESDRQSPQRPPLQFGMKALLALPIVVGMLFGTLRWLGVSPMACGVILAILAIAAVAAIGLLAALAGSGGRED